MRQCGSIRGPGFTERQYAFSRKRIARRIRACTNGNNRLGRNIVVVAEGLSRDTSAVNHRIVASEARLSGTILRVWR